MKIYRASEDCSSSIIWLFGSGLIGSAISTALEGKFACMKNEMYILAGPKSHSIIEIKKEVEKVAKKKVYFKLNSLIENESDIVFANNILPLEFKNTTVSEGIHKIMQKWSY